MQIPSYNLDLPVIAPDGRPGLCGAFTQAIKADKYALFDKFGVIVAILAKKSSSIGIEGVDSDVDVFQRFKNLRDALFHRPDVAEASLPTATVELQSLSSKYLRLHLEHTGP